MDEDLELLLIGITFVLSSMYAIVIAGVHVEYKSQSMLTLLCGMVERSTIGVGQ